MVSSLPPVAPSPSRRVQAMTPPDTPTTTTTKKSKGGVSSLVKRSSLVRQASKSFKEAGSALSERKASLSKGSGNVNSSSSGSSRPAPQCSASSSVVDEREYMAAEGGEQLHGYGDLSLQQRDSAVATTPIGTYNMGSSSSSNLLNDPALLPTPLPLSQPLPPPPPLAPPTPGSTRSEGGRRRKLMKKAKSLPKKLHVGHGGHRSSQSLPPDVATKLAQMSIGGSSPRCNRPPSSSSSSMTNAQSQFSAAAAAAAAAANASATVSASASASIIATTSSGGGGANTSASREEAPRVTVIEPLPQAPPEVMRHPRSNSLVSGSSSGIGFGNAGVGGMIGGGKLSGAEKLFRSLRGKEADELAEAAAKVGLDRDIGLKLALPDKLDIMCGRATPPPPGSAATNSNGSAAASGEDDAGGGGGGGGVDGRDDQEQDPYANPFAYTTPNSSPRKKILIVPGSQEDRDTPGRTPLSAIRKKLTIPNLASLATGTPMTGGASSSIAGGGGGMDDRSVHSASSRGSRGSRSSRRSLGAHSRDGSLSIAKPTDDRPVQAAVDPVMDEIVIRTSELEPSVHQITLPTATDLLLCARVCSLLEGYDRLLRHQAAKGRRWFDFAELVGAERHELEEAYLRALGHHKEADEQAKRQAVAGSIARMGASATIQVPSSSSSGSGNPFGTAVAPVATPAAGISATSTMEEVSLLGDTVIDAGSRFSDPKNLPHPSILKSLLDCGDDIKVEGYFTETIGEEDEGLSIPALEHGERTIFPEDYGEKSGAVTVAVFSSQQHRQFLVCYKGTAEQQAKPVKSHVKQKDANGEPSVLHPTHAVLVNPTFRESYFTNALEKKVFTLLDKLTSANPFCDVVFCGHSFGGALGMIGATRYSALFPMMTVHCHTFGTPKVGGTTFRHFANSLPNLKVMRVENGADYYPHFPLGEKWDRAGHTIVISPPQTDITTAAKDKIAKVKSGTNPIGSPSFIGKNRIPVLAYKFDKRAVGDHQPSSMPYVPSNIHKPSSKALDPLARTKKEKGKADHEMNSYLLGIERFTHLGQTWVTDYVGEEGGGIVRGGSDADYEERYLV